ncbi:hypothetical protein OESDEN_16129 [Oesophagostomum dentatum]|uniref:Uncharacterized protein n=1 Tax=Oesophagostomum dentatum TaxID=61180 RepID=A0A0B1SJX6_OESDE|nr:hypothetical protein OESDEN_16129 [Oesophagostomum dentatum]
MSLLELYFICSVLYSSICSCWSLFYTLTLLMTSFIFPIYYTCASKDSSRPPKSSKLSTSSPQGSEVPTPTPSVHEDLSKEGGADSKASEKKIAASAEPTKDKEDANASNKSKASETTKAVPSEMFESQRKAVDDGTVLNPTCVKHLGNIDDIARVSRLERCEKELSRGWFELV